MPFLVGIGQADVTGPAADVNMMGYALLEQTARGVHTRQHARAYLLAELAQQRFIMVVVDQAMVTQMLTVHVIRKLQSSLHSRCQPGMHSMACMQLKPRRSLPAAVWCRTRLDCSREAGL